jgi:hypothetical protein
VSDPAVLDEERDRRVELARSIRAATAPLTSGVVVSPRGTSSAKWNSHRGHAPLARDRAPGSRASGLRLVDHDDVGGEDVHEALDLPRGERMLRLIVFSKAPQTAVISAAGTLGLLAMSAPGGGRRGRGR